MENSNTNLDFSQLTTLTVSIENHIAHIQLSRPEQLNSMIPEFWHELPETVRRIDHESAARVIVISALGKHFSAGMDLSVFTQMAKDFSGEPARRAERLRRSVLELQDSFNALEQVRMPVLVAAQGGVIGGAVDMICAADCRYCTQDTYFTIKETEIGMTADVGTLQRLPHLIPQGLVRELAFTGRNWSAEEAMAQGFVNKVFEDQESMLDAVMKIAQKIAMNSPMAVAGCKEMINYTRDHSVQDSLTYMATWQSGMFQMPDIQEAMASQQQKRMPQYAELLDKSSMMTNK
ncbi:MULTISPECIES: crotonase/enoyl-CoA hydratase family protein [Alteromonadaceae]|uniref:crotonase/enoyl-CoA hydratase family protein n=1 Tax=Alteromonadaceae TaxID=72275 RepID=UPI001C07F520|nr:MULTISPECIES: crotonase/enoyl-CoA hydratase family protein [Aliiglaciecola]MBU2880089.1 crotonase/enoyl-CoA hydratase family protein [Aliiglaciecola lipolytica]MDO6710913.1 crotonase/enoyl-CoA hydratase family protein [Aliiglaciecola sp. 2_MG-2023]MDO6752394.1 crotonase/enoyl-CoA hydratase family protein [Aliiglaciecola sp. 1_MG-2023]